MEGLITERIGRQFKIWVEDSSTYRIGFARTKLYREAGGLYPGDRVTLNPIGTDSAVIERVYSRKNLIDPPGVANVDITFIVVSWKRPDLDERYLHRVRLMARMEKVETLIILNKIDLVETHERETYRSLLDRYQAVGISVLPISVRTGQGLDRINHYLHQGIYALAGPSGAGKSSLLNFLVPGASLRTAEVQDRTGRGRHTTTVTRLLPIRTGVWIADTPGFHKVEIRPPVRREDLEAIFPFLKKWGEACRFADCYHDREPDCGVRQAVERGDLALEWYRLYLDLYREAGPGNMV